MHTRRIFTEVCQLRVHSVIKAIGDTIHTICGECRGILRSVCRCWGYIALCRLSSPPAASPHVHRHWKALYLCWNAAQGTFVKLLNLASAVERVWQQSGGGCEQVYRGSRNTEQRRWRLKKGSIKKAPAVRTEQAAASELTSEPWAQSACLSHCLFVPPEPPPVFLFAPSFACFFLGGGKINESTYAILNSRDSFSSIKKKTIFIIYYFSHFTPTSTSSLTTTPSFLWSVSLNSSDKYQKFNFKNWWKPTIFYLLVDRNYMSQAKVLNKVQTQPHILCKRMHLTRSVCPK